MQCWHWVSVFKMGHSFIWMLCNTTTSENGHILRWPWDCMWTFLDYILQLLLVSVRCMHNYTWAITVNSHIPVMIAVVMEAFWAGDQSWFCTRASDIVPPECSSSKSIAAREKEHCSVCVLNVVLTKVLFNYIFAAPILQQRQTHATHHSIKFSEVCMHDKWTRVMNNYQLHILANATSCIQTVILL